MRVKLAHVGHFVSRIRTIPDWTSRAHFLIYAIRRFLSLLRETKQPPTTDTALYTAVRRADIIGYIWRTALKAKLGSSTPARLNLLIPALDTSIIFGGYISYFQFARYCWTQGASLRFIVTERFPDPLDAIIAHCEVWYPEIAQLLRVAEIVDYTNGNSPDLSFSPFDLLVAYSCSTALIAHNTVTALKLPPFIFYIQEEEGHFHAHNSMRALMESVYDLPHTAVFNSPLLENFYRQNRLGLFCDSDGEGKSVNFRHALAVNRIPTIEELGARRVKKLVFFARPEPHAERNLFELGLVALRYATYQNLFPAGEWELHAIGTDCYAAEPLYNGQKLSFIGRFPLAEYSARLANYDVGLSLMYAPHPSVPNFEMAASGVVTVTTEFSNRRKTEMEQLCPNFIAAKANVDSLVEALREAVQRSGDFEARRRNARFAWPRRWDESFDETFSTSFKAMVADNYPAASAKIFPRFRGAHRVRPTLRTA